MKWAASPLDEVALSEKPAVVAVPGANSGPAADGPGAASAVAGRIAGVTGAILAGGRSSRMGSDKALLPIRDERFIESIYALLSRVVREVIVVTNAPERYSFLPCRKVPDLLPGAGPLSGIHSALIHSMAPRVFVVGCDMPHLSEELVRRVAGSDCDLKGAVVPAGTGGLEPLHALYGKGCIPAVAAAISRGDRRIVSFFDQVAVTVIGTEEICRLDPKGHSFSNINTPQEYHQLLQSPGAQV